MHDQIKVAREWCDHYHGDQVDCEGKLLALHPWAVAREVRGVTEKTVAYLHDLAALTDVTLEMIAREFGTDIAGHVDSLTRRPNEDDVDYVERLSLDSIAVRVNLAHSFFSVQHA